MRTGRRDWLWGVAIGTVVLAAGFFVLVAVRGNGIKTYATVDEVECQSGEMLDFHIHAYLAILVDGERVEVPANVGIRDNECLFWLHTHDNSGIVHIESPETRDFTLGQFFAVWGQPLSATQLLDNTADSSHHITATVNGEPFSGDPSTIVLADQQSIVLQFGPPFGEAPASPFGPG